MEIKLKVGSIQNESTECIVLSVFEDGPRLSAAAEAVDTSLGQLITQVMTDGDFKGKSKELSVLYGNGKTAVKRVVLVGMGKHEKYNSETIRVAAGTAAKRVRELGIKKFSAEMFGADRKQLPSAEVSQAMVEGITLALYEFTELKSDKAALGNQIEEATLFITDQADQNDAQAGAAAGKAIATGTYLTRDLVNWPGNYATPTFLAEKARQLALRNNLTCQVLEEDEMRQLGMGALLGVAAGSPEAPKFIILEHNANRSDLETIVLVGKGVTFDTGGISIKPADDMARMRSDMAGSAAVLGAMSAVSELNLPLHVVVLIPSVENMPDGKAFKPGDVLTAMNGKTIEVINTDCEGRMILADALCYASRYQPRLVVDIATLTGARTQALGDQAIGLFTNEDELAVRFSTAGQKTHERTWQLPMFEEYGENLKSFAADMKHAGGNGGGACIAAVFLKKFVSYPWAHLDIAGLVSSENERPYTPRWATGLGARVITQFLRDWAAK